MSRSNMSRTFVPAALAVLLLACEPMTVSVAPAGRIAFSRSEGIFAVDLEKQALETIAPAGDGKPTLVRWSPDGKKVAYFMITGEGFGESHELFLRGEAGTAKSLYKVDQPVLFLQWSPDGKSVTFAQADSSGEAKGAVLHLVDVESGEDKVIAKEVSAVHHWTPEGWIVLFQVDGEHKEGSGLFVGAIATLDPKSGEIKEHVHASSGRNAWLSISPDGSKVAFLALAAAMTHEELQLPGEEEGVDTNETHAFVYDFAAKKLDAFADGVVQYLAYSPDGQRMMWVSKAEEGDAKILRSRQLSTGEDKELDGDVVTEASKDMSSVPLYYVWLDANRIFYWKMKITYGRTASQIAAHIVDVTSGKSKNVQYVIDKLVDEASSK